MKKGDKIILKNHPEWNNANCEIAEYELGGRIYLHAKNKNKGILLAITSPEGEPWDILTLKSGENGTNYYEAFWRRETTALNHFKEEI